MANIQDLQPQGIWKNFYALTQVPRPSGHLDKIQKYLLDWAAQRNIEAFMDNAGNIIMRKAAPMGDPLEINVRGYELSLRKAEAKDIKVEVK